ncbi:hypothetical protein L249_6200 [Ophiocordyceps polyrhachis-furcata BCC 54312]|uniref:Uncharacterized protein n=1 Tax=Ophiocordyceps polyrhachis-furcata BCC 54312 TaxID=1330021 RepID=A0A367LIR7_9HYPO|nr:hypothetical protein L249_6200 [Ophiocordyceps polyrhachis-furcata BCC 54312]
MDAETEIDGQDDRIQGKGPYLYRSIPSVTCLTDVKERASKRTTPINTRIYNHGAYYTTTCQLGHEIFLLALVALQKRR